MPRRLFKKGEIHSPGRPKGVPNKFTTLREAFLNAFKEIGGEKAIVEWLETGNLILRDKNGEVIRIVRSGDRRKEFFKMIAQMLPRDVHIAGPLPEALLEKYQGTSTEDLKQKAKELIQ